MSAPAPVTLTPADTDWPASLAERMGQTAPPALQVIGPVALLARRKTALFCSARTPGDAILHAHDTAQRLRDRGMTVISGFHSPIEKECLRIVANKGMIPEACFQGFSSDQSAADNLQLVQVFATLDSFLEVFVKTGGISWPAHQMPSLRNMSSASSPRTIPLP